MLKERPSGANGENRVEVHLKPFLGLRPGVYLTVLYALLALAVLFFLFFYKGLRDRGVFLRVVSTPPGAAVSIDGRYAGSTPCEILVPKGPRRIEASRPYFQAMTLEDDFPAPIFGTLFVRPRRQWNPKLQILDLPGLTGAALQDFAANPHVPEILEQTAVAALTAGSGEASAHLSAFLQRAKFFVTSPLQYKYFQQAYSLLHPEAGDPDELTARIRDFASEGGRFDNLPFWLATVLPEEASRSLQSSAAYQDFARGYQEQLRALASRLRTQTVTGSGPALRVEGLAFRPVPAGTLLAGSLEETSAAYLPHPVPMASFLASETEVPNRLYARFLTENPEWLKQNAAALVQQGQVDDAYLSNWTEQGFPAGEGELPVTAVSFFAAQAFCRWLSSRLPSSLAGYEARLPSEAEWEWAARGGLVGSPYPQGSKPQSEVFFEPGIAGPRPAGSSAPNGYGLRDTSGNVWEWCSDWFSPVAYLFSSGNPDGNSAQRSSEIPFGAEKAVRGGSWANEKELVKLHTRASQPPSWCTPYLGFRVVLARARP